MEELNKEKGIEELKLQRDQYLAGWQRERADLMNYKKDEIERIQELVKYANAEFLLRLLPLVDNLERALRAIPEEEKNGTLAKGFSQLGSQMKEFLKNQGAQEVQAEGKFNPEFHEALQEVEVEGKSSGTIIEVVDKGYMLGGKLLRAARVKIAK